jgi:hypothetical protein
MEPMPQVSFAGEIPGDASEKRAVQQAIREALQGFRGAWRVEVIPARHSSWWLIRVDGGDGLHHALLAGRREHDPEQLRHRIRESVLRDVRLAMRRGPERRPAA